MKTNFKRFLYICIFVVSLIVLMSINTLAADKELIVGPGGWGNLYNAVTNGVSEGETATIYLMQDITMDYKLPIANKNITITSGDGGPYTITGTKADDWIFNISGTSNVTFSNVNIDMSGDGVFIYSSSSGSVTMTEDSTLRILHNNETTLSYGVFQLRANTTLNLKGTIQVGTPDSYVNLSDSSKEAKLVYAYNAVTNVNVGGMISFYVSGNGMYVFRGLGVGYIGSVNFDSENVPVFKGTSSMLLFRKAAVTTATGKAVIDGPIQETVTNGTMNATFYYASDEVAKSFSKTLRLGDVILGGTGAYANAKAETSYYTSLSDAIAAIPEGGEGTIYLLVPRSTSGAAVVQFRHVTLVGDGSEGADYTYTGTSSPFLVRDYGSLIFKDIDVVSSGPVVAYDVTANTTATEDKDILIKFVNSNIDVNTSSWKLIDSPALSSGTVNGDEIRVVVDKDSTITFTSSDSTPWGFSFGTASHARVFVEIDGTMNLNYTHASISSASLLRVNNPASCSLTISETANINVDITATTPAAAYLCNLAYTTQSNNTFFIHADAITDENGLTLDGMKLSYGYTEARLPVVTLVASSLEHSAELSSWVETYNGGTKVLTFVACVNVDGEYIYYKTIEDAIAAIPADGSGTVYLLNDATVVAAISIDKSVTVNGSQGGKLVNGSSDYMFTVSNGADLIFNDVDIETNGKFISVTDAAGTITLDENTTLTITSADQLSADGTFNIAAATEALNLYGTIKMGEAGNPLVISASEIKLIKIAAAVTNVNVGGDIDIYVSGGMTLFHVRDVNTAFNFTGSLDFHVTGYSNLINMLNGYFKSVTVNGATLTMTHDGATSGTAADYSAMFYYSYANGDISIVDSTINLGAEGTGFPLVYGGGATTLTISGSSVINQNGTAGKAYVGNGGSGNVFIVADGDKKPVINGSSTVDLFTGGYTVYVIDGATVSGTVGSSTLAYYFTSDEKAVENNYIVRLGEGTPLGIAPYADAKTGYYTTVANAVSAIASEGTIYLLDDITVGTTVAVSGKSVTITSPDGQKYTYTSTLTDSYPFSLGGSGNLTLSNINVTVKSRVLYVGTAAGAFTIDTDSTLTITSPDYLSANGSFRFDAGLEALNLYGTINVGTAESPLVVAADGNRLIKISAEVSTVNVGGDISIYTTGYGLMFLELSGSYERTINFTGDLSVISTGCNSSTRCQLINDNGGTNRFVIDGANINFSYDGKCDTWTSLFYIRYASNTIEMTSGSITVSSGDGQGFPIFYIGSAGCTTMISGNSVLTNNGSSSYATIFTGASGTPVLIAATDAGKPALTASQAASVFDATNIDAYIIDGATITGTVGGKSVGYYFTSDEKAIENGNSVRVDNVTLGGTSPYADAKTGYYKNIVDAISAITSEGTIYLLDDITVGTTVAVSGKSVTITSPDGQKYTYTSTLTDSYPFSLGGSGNLTLSNINVTVKSRVLYVGTAAGAFTIDTDTTLTITSPDYLSSNGSFRFDAGAEALNLYGTINVGTAESPLVVAADGNRLIKISAEVSTVNVGGDIAIYTTGYGINFITASGGFERDFNFTGDILVNSSSCADTNYYFFIDTASETSNITIDGASINVFYDGRCNKYTNIFYLRSETDSVEIIDSAITVSSVAGKGLPILYVEKVGCTIDVSGSSTLVNNGDSGTAVLVYADVKGTKVTLNAGDGETIVVSGSDIVYMFDGYVYITASGNIVIAGGKSLGGSSENNDMTNAHFYFMSDSSATEFGYVARLGEGERLGTGAYADAISQSSYRSSLASALSDITSGGTIYIIKNTDLGKTTISEKAVTISSANGGPHTITSTVAASSWPITMANGASLTLDEVTVEANGLLLYVDTEVGSFTMNEGATLRIVNADYINYGTIRVFTSGSMESINLYGNIIMGSDNDPIDVTVAEGRILRIQNNVKTLNVGGYVEIHTTGHGTMLLAISEGLDVDVNISGTINASYGNISQDEHLIVLDRNLKGNFVVTGTINLTASCTSSASVYAIRAYGDNACVFVASGATISVNAEGSVARSGKFCFGETYGINSYDTYYGGTNGKCYYHGLGALLKLLSENALSGDTITITSSYSFVYGANGYYSSDITCAYDRYGAITLSGLLSASTRADNIAASGYEVMLGRVNRTLVGNNMSRIKENEVAILVENGQVAILAWNDTALDLGIESLKYLINNNGGKLPNGFFTAVVNEDWIVDFTKPDDTLSDNQDVNDDCLQYVYENKTEAEFNTYCQTLESEGYTLVWSNRIEGSTFRLYKNLEKGIALYVAYNDFTYKTTFAGTDGTGGLYAEEESGMSSSTSNSGVASGANFNDDHVTRNYQKTIRVVVGPISSVTVPDEALGTPDKTYEKVTDPFVTVLSMQGDAVGFGQVWMLEDGTFIVIDGGGLNEDGVNANGIRESEMIWNVLNAMYVKVYGKTPAENNDTIHISAWYLTHGHTDHWQAFEEMARTHGADFELDYVIANLPAEASLFHNHQTDVAKGYIEDLRGYINGGFEFVKVHTGQKLYFANLEMEVLMTFEDHLPYEILDANDTNTIIRFTVNNSDALEGVAAPTVMYLGDSWRHSSRYLCEMYGDYLKSDIVQLAHHGNIGCERILYKTIAATAVFFPNDGTNSAGGAMANYVYFNGMSSSNKSVERAYAYAADIWVMKNTHYIYAADYGNTGEWGGDFNVLEFKPARPDYDNVYDLKTGAKVSLSAYPGRTGGSSSSGPVYIKNDTANGETLSNIVSVNIYWGDLSFSYDGDEATWNPETLSYEGEGSWVPNGTPNIIVENAGWKSVSFSLSYSSNVGYENFKGSFKDGANSVENPSYTLAVFDRKELLFEIDTTSLPDSELDGAVVGGVTITIS